MHGDRGSGVAHTLDPGVAARSPNPADDPRSSHSLGIETIEFPSGRARAVIAPLAISGEQAIAALDLFPARGVVALNGGTRELGSELLEPLRAMLIDGFARVAHEEQLTVVTGATDVGIFALCGAALADQAAAPVIGVAPVGRVSWPRRERPGIAAGGEKPVSLEPHHSHFLLVTGDRWGDETEAMLALLAALDPEGNSVAVLAGGGEGAKVEVLGHARSGRPVIALAGSGRFADDLAASLTGEGTADAVIAEIVASGQVSIVDLADSPAVLAERIRECLGRRGGEQS